MSKVKHVRVRLMTVGQVTTCDALEYQGDVWLVPKWIDTPAAGTRQPERMIRTPKAALQSIPQNPAYAYFLQWPVPPSFLTATAPLPPYESFELVLLPSLTLPLS